MFEEKQKREREAPPAAEPNADDDASSASSVSSADDDEAAARQLVDGVLKYAVANAFVREVLETACDVACSEASRSDESG